MVVTAETLTIETRDETVIRITADGDDAPATYEQLLAVGDPQKVLGRAASIVYVTEEERIEFAGDAELSQASDRFTGQRITYDLRERRVAADAGEDGERMTFTISPSRLRGSGGTDPGT